jgi:hypothetical protein
MAPPPFRATEWTRVLEAINLNRSSLALSERSLEGNDFSRIFPGVDIDRGLWNEKVCLTSAGSYGVLLRPAVKMSTRFVALNAALHSIKE